MKKYLITLSSLLLFVVFVAGGKNDEEPRVEKSINGKYKLILNDSQLNAVSKYLSENPSIKLVTKDEYNPDSDQMELFKKGEMQYPYICWSDFNKDGYLDLCFLFVEKVQQGYSATWWVVVFNGTKSGIYKPEIITNNIQASFAPGLMYHKKNNYVEFFAYGKAAGTFHWDGQKYVVENPQMVGD